MIVLQDALAALTDVRVLSWSNLKPGAFGGFTTPGGDADFDKYYEALTINANWCCSGGHWSTGEDEIPNWLQDLISAYNFVSRTARSVVLSQWTIPIYDVTWHRYGVFV